MKTRILGYALFLIIGLSIIGLWLQFINTHEKKTREVVQYSSSEARQNPFLASELFLKQLQIKAESVAGREFLLTPPKSTGLLMVFDIDQNLSNAKQQQLWQWVEKGGHLIFQVNSADWDDDLEDKDTEKKQKTSFLTRLGIVVKSKYNDFFDVEEETKEKEKTTKKWYKDIQIPSYNTPFSLDTSISEFLLDTDKKASWGVLAHPKGGYFALQYKIKRGKITVLSDLDLFKNRHIRDKDNALFLAILADKSPNAWILYTADSRSVFEKLWKNSPLIVIHLILLIFIFLWWNSRYTGPRLNLTGQGRRNLMEHLYASANYTWQIDKNQRLLRKNQQHIEAKWKKRHPILARKNQARFCQWVADFTGFTPSEVNIAFYLPIDNAQEFIQTSALLQKLDL